MRIQLQSIGVIRTPFVRPEGVPIQPVAGAGIRGTVELFEEYRAGLTDLDGFSHLILLYYFHCSQGFRLSVKPFLDDATRGLFATRAPSRPNAIGLSVVQLDKVESGILHIQNLDILDGTPLLDIKPYVPEFDSQVDVRTGWLEYAENKLADKRSDGRFIPHARAR
jgi:tRNA-Thr(GGU) m(6)t(6)A37 methyltransferase TsaA